MPSTQYIAKPVLTARDAIASHVRWKITLLTAAKMREALSERATRNIENPQECVIYRWLVSDQTLALRRTPEYREVLQRHGEFHREMQRVTQLLNADQFAEAEGLLAPGSSFERASLGMANALMAFDRIQRRPLAS